MNHDEFNEAERRSKLRMQVIYEGAKKPKKEWVDLTEDDLKTLNKIAKNKASAIILAEALLREKNT